MKVAKTRLKQIGLRNQTQYKVLRQLVKLWENHVSYNRDSEPYILIQVKDIHPIFFYSVKTVSAYFKDLEDAGYIDFVPLKPGGHSGKISEYCITVFEKAKRVVHKENSLQKRIKQEQNKIKSEYDDFPV